jgi:signal transduction histidine kinase
MIAPKIDSETIGNPVKVLHLEDSDLDHRLLLRALSTAALDAQVHRVDSLDALIEALQTKAFDIILMDFKLPGFTALEAWAHIKEIPEYPPCVIISGTIGEQAAVNAIQTGISDFLHKDHLPEIGRVIHRAMHLRHMERQRAEAQKELALSEQTIRELARHLQSSVEEERAAISREIHDDIGGSLAALRLELGRIKRHIDDPVAVSRLIDAEETLNLALLATQRIMQNTRPAILDQGLSACVQWLAQAHSRRTGRNVSVQNRLRSDLLPDSFRLTAYRVVQESLTNAGKYAPQSDIRIEASDAGGTLTIEISDTGPGFLSRPDAPRKGFGLRGLRERAESIGGWLDVSSAPGKGTTITLSAPIPTDSDNAQEVKSP